MRGQRGAGRWGGEAEDGDSWRFKLAIDKELDCGGEVVSMVCWLNGAGKTGGGGSGSVGLGLGCGVSKASGVGWKVGEATKFEWLLFAVKGAGRDEEPVCDGAVKCRGGAAAVDARCGSGTGRTAPAWECGVSEGAGSVWGA